ncbi:MAG TPA: substrate-binding domain-containing protein [Reyranella sp.]|nr:substrate-binding domain-containing protein [Reyranella sp.]
MMRRLLVALLVLAGVGTASAETLTVLTAGAYKPVLLDVLTDFEKQTGHKVTVLNDTAGALSQRVRTGEAFDVLVLPTTSLESLAAEGRVTDDSVTPLAKVGIGVAVPLSAPIPNIGSTEGLRRALLDARSVAYIDPASGGTSGIYVARMFQMLGIASEMQKKSVLVRGGLAAERVARGEAEMAIQQASELRLVPTVRFAGMLPPGVQNYTIYAGALSPEARRKHAAFELMSALTDTAIEPVLRKRGLEYP